MKIYKPVLILLITLWVPFGMAQASIEVPQAEQIIARALTQEALYWNPFPLPYDIAQTSKHKDGLFLQTLFDYGLLDREEKLLPIESNSAQPQYQKIWRYTYKEGRNPYAPEGFYYGRGELVKLLSLSEAQINKGVLYVNARVQWSVAYMQMWAQDPAFQQARTLRRSQESASKPFERDFVLMYNAPAQAWELWQEPEF